MDADPNDNWDPVKPGAKERVFLLGVVDLIPETHHNLSTILEALNFPLPLPNVQFSADLKLLIISLGIHGTKAMHSCPYCFGYRFQKRDQNGEPIKYGNAGRWREGAWRTANNCQEWYERWMAETGEDEDKLSKFMSCKYPALDIFGPENGDVPFLVLCPPGPLHVGILGEPYWLFFYQSKSIICIEGPGNNALHAMEELYPVVMAEFYDRFGYKKGGGPGGQDFTGKILRSMTKADKLEELSRMLGEDGDLWISFLKSIHEAHSMMVQDKLDADYQYEEKMFEFQRCFETVHQAYGLSETLKVF